MCYQNHQMSVGNEQKCKGNEEAVQCDLCCMWEHSAFDGITTDQYNATVTLSTIGNSVYFCNINNCTTSFRNLMNEWIQHQACGVVPTLINDVKQLASAHSTIEKAVSDLSKNRNLAVAGDTVS